MVAKKKEASFQPSGDVRRVQSLNEGQHVRIFDHLGKSHHLATRDRPALLDLMLRIHEANLEMYERIGNELADLGIEVAEIKDAE